MLDGKRKKSQEKEGREEGGNGCLKTSVGPVGQRPRAGARSVRHLAEGRASQNLGREAGEPQSSPAPAAAPALLLRSSSSSRGWGNAFPLGTRALRLHDSNSGWCPLPPRPAGPAILAWRVAGRGEGAGGCTTDARTAASETPGQGPGRAPGGGKRPGGAPSLPTSRPHSRWAPLRSSSHTSHASSLPVQTAGRSPRPLSLLRASRAVAARGWPSLQGCGTTAAHG